MGLLQHESSINIYWQVVRPLQIRGFYNKKEAENLLNSSCSTPSNKGLLQPSQYSLMMIVSCYTPSNKRLLQQRRTIKEFMICCSTPSNKGLLQRISWQQKNKQHVVIPFQIQGFYNPTKCGKVDACVVIPLQIRGFYNCWCQRL